MHRATIFLVFSLGFFVSVGWLFQIESMVRVSTGSGVMGINVALLFIVAAVSLRRSQQKNISRYFQKICGWILIILPSLILFEHWRDIDIGIDWVALHSTVKDGSLHPGRMAPNTCVAFLLTGIVALSFSSKHLTKRIQRLIRLLSYLIVAIGFIALVGYILTLEEMYTVATFNRMAASTAVGIILVGSAVRFRLQQEPTYLDKLPPRPDLHITKIAAVVLTTVALFTGLIGFTVLKHGFESSMSDASLRTVKNNATAISNALHQKITLASTIAARPALQKDLFKINNDPGDITSLKHVKEVSSSYVPFGISGIDIINANGLSLSLDGTLINQNSIMAIPLQGPVNAFLLWHHGFVLYTQHNVQVDGISIGKVLVEQRMLELDDMLRNVEAGNESTDFLLCGRNLDDALCYPSRFYKANFRIPIYKNGKPFLAISRALLKQTGVMSVTDLRGNSVLAAYAPVGDWGLGIVLKSDAVELYGPIRQRLNIFFVLLIAVIIAGTTFLRSQILPLARSLVKEKRRMEVLLENTHEAFFEIDQVGVISDWNTEAERIFGWSRTEVVGKPLTKIFNPLSEQREQNIGIIHLLENADVPTGNKRVELQVLHRSGKTFPVEVTISSVKTGDEISLTAFVHDISERKEVENALRESEERFRTFMNYSTAVAFLKDEDGRMLYANRAFEEAFGLRTEDWINKVDAQLWPEDIANALRKNDLEIYAKNEPLTLEEIVPTIQGSQTWIAHKFPLISVLGKRFIGGIGINITERKQAEEQIFREKESLRITLNSIGDAVITTDMVGKVTYLNPVAEQMTGWSNQEAEGQALESVFHIVNENTGEVAPSPVKFVLLNQKTGGLAEFTTLIHRNGERFGIEDSAAPIRDRENNIIGVVLVFHDVSKARKMAAEMTYQATHDALTGLINRREFERRLEFAVQTGKQGDKQHTMLYLDLDQFKIVNDTCGHVAGDELLRQLTTLIESQLRKSDTLARLGGDEFGVLLESCGTEPSLRIADILRQTVSDFHFVWLDKVFPIGVSIGLVTFSNGGITIADVLRMADAACYVAKDRGRNCVHVYSEGDHKLSQRHGEMGWIGRIQKALDENRFVLYSQKIMAINQSEKQVDHYEVLLRLRDELGELIPPMAFIPAAERYGLMPLVDRWVIKTVFEKLSSFDPLDAGFYTCSINLSGNSICDENFLGFVKEQFAFYPVSPRNICFEITETAAIASLSQAVTLMRALKDIGCRFSLDDFGSGMSSFAYLKHLPVDYLKIDGSFIKDIISDPIDRTMVESINHIGHVMGIKTIAEFVENDEILAALREMGVDFAQGYGVAKPAPL
ncbi:EAL domain-containing protein [Undibacterium sp. Di27W]